jgi:hypothetical protein
VAIIALAKQGAFQRRISAARRALKSANYRLVKSRAT